MMFPTLRITLLSFLVVIASTLSAQRVFRDVNPVPPDFGKAPGTLLLIRSEQKGANKSLQTVFTKYYHGPFKVIDAADLYEPEYADKDIYRYTFNTMIEFVPGYGSGEYRTAPSYNYTFKVVDRQEPSWDAPIVNGLSCKGLMTDYAKKLEEVRASGK